MKRGSTLSLLSLILLVIGLSACTGGGTVINGWPGITIDETKHIAYVASYNEMLAIKTDDGTLLWQFPEKEDKGKQFFAPPTLTADGQLIAPGYDFRLYSINAETGQQKWMFEDVKGRFVASPLVNGETIYAACSDDKLYALDMQGKPRWIFEESKQALWAKPIIVEKTLIQASMDHFLYALDAETGKSIWKTNLGGAMVSTPVLNPETQQLIVGTFNKELLAVSLDGKIQWRVPVDGWIWSAPTLVNNQLIFGDNSGTLYALDAANGKTVWKIQPSVSPIVGKPLYTAEKVFFGTEAGELYAVNQKGEVLWNHTIGGKLTGDLLLDGEQILLAPMNMEAKLIAVDVDGNQKWSYTPVKK